MRTFRVSIPDIPAPVLIRAARLVTEGQNAILFGEGALVVATVGLHPGVVIVDEEFLESAGEEETEE